jgi:hypothetical protein
MKAVRLKHTGIRAFAWLLLPMLQLILLCLLARPAGPVEWQVLTGFVVITAFSSWHLFAADRHPYSLNKIWWLFAGIFLGFIPSIQAALYHTPWYLHDITHQVMLKTNFVIGGCLLLYWALHTYLSRQNLLRALPFEPMTTGYIKRFPFVAPALLLLCGAALFTAYGWQGLFLRGYLDTRAHYYNPTFQLLFDKGIRGIVLYLSLMTIILYRQGRVSVFFMLGMLLPAFVLNFPLAIPRYLAFTVYMSWLLAAQWKWMERGKVFVLGILSVLLLAGPLVGVTRYAGIDMGNRIKHPSAIFEQAYLTADYDAYSSLCRTIYYVDTAGSTQGRQLGGVALFFVPRKVWPQKPIGSGAFLFTELGFDFKNVSCTWLAEGYINFGLAGSILFTIIMAIGIACYDHAFWTNRQIGNNHYLYIFYFIFTGMLMFILRGDLLSSFAYTCGLFFSGLILHKLLKAGTK